MIKLKSNLYDFQKYKNDKNNKKYTKVMPIKQLSPESMRSSMEFKKRSWDRED
jgi:hypothetical protein